MGFEMTPAGEGRDYTLLRFTGRLDADKVDEYRTSIQQIIAPKVRLVGDLTELKYISSAGINLLIFTHRQATAAGGEFRIAGVQRYVSEVLKLAGCTKFFRLYDTVEAATR